MALEITQIEKKVIEVLAEKACVDQGEINADTHLVDDLGMDSLDAVEMVFEIEENYGIDIPDDQIAKFQKVKDVVDYLVNTLSE